MLNLTEIHERDFLVPKKGQMPHFWAEINDKIRLEKCKIYTSKIAKTQNSSLINNWQKCEEDIAKYSYKAITKIKIMEFFLLFKTYKIKNNRVWTTNRP